MPAAREQQVYARWLDWGTRIGLAALVASFFAYAFGALEPLVQLEHLPGLWSLPLEDYLALSGAPTGWAWITRLGHGEPLCLAAIAVLSTVTLACYLRLLVQQFRSGARLHAWIALAQAAVLVAAMSSLVSGGH
jgi:hypothetical protein